MNRNHSFKLPSMVLLFVMLLNPIMGLAGTLWHESSIHDVQIMNTDTESEHCQEHASMVNTSDKLQSVSDAETQHTDCCDDPCMCGYGGCHSTIAMLEINGLSLIDNDTIFFTFHTNYRNPSLSSVTPPPII